LETLWFNSLPSTQTYLAQKIKSGELNAPVCVATDMQTDGLGSRGNKWESEDGDLFFSFAVPLASLPHDLKIESASIYFMYIFKTLLAKQGSKCWFKWPNDIYIGDLKIGGAITSFDNQNKTLICGIGINLTNHKNFGKCDIKVDKKSLLCKYLSIFKAFPEWKQIFINFRVEFSKTIDMPAYRDSLKCIESTTLNDDGSLSVNDKKVFSLR
jgi:BirA family transcriptional regulator, biotin operon repressor / biotin---[acetyl-CoA-carboxylase] ligase